MKRSARLARLKMMTPKLQLRMLVLALGVLVVFLVAGCKKPSTAFYPRSSTSHSVQQHTKTQTQHDTLREQAVKTVSDYLTALEHDEYAVAYKLLSQESQSAHTLADYEEQGKQGMTSFDLKPVTVTITGANAMVELPQVEDPASHGFYLVREDGAWKIVYRGGSPSSPSPVSRTGG